MLTWSNSSKKLMIRKIRIKEMRLRPTKKDHLIL